MEEELPFSERIVQIQAEMHELEKEHKILKKEVETLRLECKLLKMNKDDLLFIDILYVTFCAYSGEGGLIGHSYGVQTIPCTLLKTKLEKDDKLTINVKLLKQCKFVTEIKDCDDEDPNDDIKEMVSYQKSKYGKGKWRVVRGVYIWDDKKHEKVFVKGPFFKQGPRKIIKIKGDSTKCYASVSLKEGKELELTSCLESNSYNWKDHLPEPAIPMYFFMDDFVLRAAFVSMDQNKSI